MHLKNWLLSKFVQATVTILSINVLVAFPSKYPVTLISNTSNGTLDAHNDLKCFYGDCFVSPTCMGDYNSINGVFIFCII